MSRENTTITIETQGNQNQIKNVGNTKIRNVKKSSKISIAIGVVVIAAIVVAVSIWLGGSDPAHALIGDWAYAGESETAISFLENGTFHEAYSDSGTFRIRDDNSLLLQGWWYGDAFNWNRDGGSGYWYVSGNRLLFDGREYVRVGR